MGPDANLNPRYRWPYATGGDRIDAESVFRAQVLFQLLTARPVQVHVNLILIHCAEHLRAKHHGGRRGWVLRLWRWQRRWAGCIVLVASVSVGPLTIRTVGRIQISRFRYIAMGHGLMRGCTRGRWNAIIILVRLGGIWKNCELRLMTDYIDATQVSTYLQGDYNWDALPSDRVRNRHTKEELFELVNSC